MERGHRLGVEEILKPHLREIRQLARKHGASRLTVFGSVRKGQATERSDVDLLVKWKRPVSLLDRSGLCGDLERVLGRNVDLVNEGGLHWAIEPQIMAEALPL